MNTSLNTSLRSRLSIVVGFIALMAVGIGALGLFGMDKANDGLKTVYENRTVALEQISRIDRLLVQSQLELVEAIQDSMAATIKKKSAQIEKNIGEIDQTWGVYAQSELSSSERQLADTFNSDKQKIINDGLRSTIKAMNDGDLAHASELLDTVQALAVPLRKSLDALRKIQVDQAKGDYEQANSRYQILRGIVVAVIIGGGLLAGALGYYLIKNVYGQLGGEPSYAQDIVHGIAAGDLTIAIDLHADDTKSLLFAMKSMQQKLSHTMLEIRDSTDTIATASNEISLGNMDLSSRTESQASALEETSASLIDLTNSVKTNADNTRQANQLARSASDVAHRGSTAVLQIVDTMGSINTSARKITDIISVIDSIAFQTNILALNAAVEAARAGEQGRGFAVVASEVRNLAQRSAAAAKEIKELISRSVQEVNHGSSIVASAGATMKEIVDSVQLVTEIMAVISTANEEQRDEINQVSSAINQIDEGTQRNSALVEEAAAASESLRQQSELLAELVGTFKLDDAHQIQNLPANQNIKLIRRLA